MKKLMICLCILLALLNTCVFATETVEDTQIPEMSFEDLLKTMKARQAKVDIIKKNNKEITTLKEELKTQIVEAATKVNELKIEVYHENVEITTETIEELKEAGLCGQYVQHDHAVFPTDVNGVPFSFC